MEGGWVTGTTKQPRLATVTPIKKKSPQDSSIPNPLNKLNTEQNLTKRVNLVNVTVEKTM